MSSTPNSDAGGSTDHNRLIDALAMREIRRGLVNSDLDVDHHDVTRDDVRAMLENHPDAEQLRQEIITGAKESLLGQGHVKTDSIEGTGQGFSVIRDSLTLAEAYYYDSYFQFTNHTTRVYSIPSLDGLLREIAGNTDTSTAAREKFVQYCEENDLDEAYSQAAGDIPASLIGDIDSNYRPRLIKFEDADHIHVEYWKEGNTKSHFDIQTGDYETIQTRYRAVLRIDLRTGLVQTAGSSSQNSHQNLVEHFLEEFNNSSQVHRIEIRGPQIRTTKENLALLISLNEFLGDEAKLRFTRNQAGNVEADPAHDQMEQERDYSKSNFQVFLGQAGEQWELVYPTMLGGVDLEPSDGEITTNEILKAIDGGDATNYNDVLDLTVSLDSEKSTLRIRKTELSPGTRRQMFELLADELDWTA